MKFVLLLISIFSVCSSQAEMPWSCESSQGHVKQWALDSTEKYSTGLQNLSPSTREIVVAVIDSGLDRDHPDLAGLAWANLSEKNGVEGVDDDGNGYIDDIYGYNFIEHTNNTLDNHHHGTHCSAIIVTNRIYMRGVLINVKIMPIKIFSVNENGATTMASEHDLARAIDYAVDNRATIINASWGTNVESMELLHAIQRANEAGIPMVVAAGNFGRDLALHPMYPASYKLDNIFVVGALNAQGERYQWSNFGDRVDIYAPGVGICSALPTSLAAKWKVELPYVKLDGTSQATPFVTALLASFLQNEPELDLMSLRDKLKQYSLYSNLLGGSWLRYLNENK